MPRNGITFALRAAAALSLLGAAIVVAQPPALSEAVQQIAESSPGRGRFPALKEEVASLPRHVIYRPANLAALGDQKLGAGRGRRPRSRRRPRSPVSRGRRAPSRRISPRRSTGRSPRTSGQEARTSGVSIPRKLLCLAGVAAVYRRSQSRRIRA
jgi:hypothetical protein